MRLTKSELGEKNSAPIYALRSATSTRHFGPPLGRIRPIPDAIYAPPVTVRTYRRQDKADVARLYTEGLLQGWIDPFDGAGDLDEIERTYLDDPRNHFWIAKVGGSVVGMIAVAHEQPHVAQVRRLRVEPAWRHSGVPAKLIQAAMEHCKRHGYLKVIFSTHFQFDAAVALLERHGFQHARSKQATGKQMLEFYVNLYRRSEAETSGRSGQRLGA